MPLLPFNMRCLRKPGVLVSALTLAELRLCAMRKLHALAEHNNGRCPGLYLLCSLVMPGACRTKDR